MKRLIVSAALFGLLGLGLAIGHAQPARSGAGPVVDEERMAQMMKMMGEMQEQMKGMREQMQGMGHMMGQMGQMHAMMEQHRGQMSHQCSSPGPAQPSAPHK
jgi:hypothetical protein